ncbi:MAG: TIGR04282 family arsenosugar biosynthesis glycosyltransferase [Bacteroidota bacterium]
MTPALIVFAKVPAAGRVKTRLGATIGPEAAADLYDAFLRDALDRYARLGAEAGMSVRLYLGGRPEPAGLVPEGVSVHDQHAGALGERMLHAFVETFAAGHDRAVVIGTDHPTLPLDYIPLALDALAEPMTAVLGPSDDGGYYLLGLNEVGADLFDMDYSHPRVFADTLDRVAEMHLQPVVLPAHYDVDDGTGLHRLIEEWRTGADVGTRTARMLRSLTERDDQAA